MDAGWNARALLNSTKSSPGLSPKVLGGNEAQPGQFPFMASLRYPLGYINVQGKAVGGDHLCGGTLIARNVVLTAAHCVHDQALRDPVVHINRYYRVGEGDYEIFRTTATKIHPNYKAIGGWTDYDVAILVLDGSSATNPTCLNQDESCFSYGCTGTVIGWGHTGEGDANSYADVLQMADVPLTSRQNCRRAYGKLPFDSEFITDVMVCAGAQGIDACIGDSGGPLVLGNCIAGIVAWGAGCGTSKPGVYTSVLAMTDWIQEQLAEAQQVAPYPPPVPQPLTPPPPSPPPVYSPRLQPQLSPPRPSPFPTGQHPASPPSCTFILGRYFPIGCEG